MGEFEVAFSRLNKRQLEAVTQLEGPVLVIAGPGTGKTQLISTRAGHILNTTDATASDILCLTFTNTGVSEMRERLIKLIGKDAYSINLYTYHAFGGEILRRNPEYFNEAQLEPVEDLRQDIMLRDIIARLPYSNPLKFADNYLWDIKDFISDCKQALLSPDDVIAAAEDNLNYLEKINGEAKKTLDEITSISKKALPLFERLLAHLNALQTEKPPQAARSVLPLGNYCMEELTLALQDYDSSGKTTQLTQWKKDWLEKNTEGKFIFKGKKMCEKLYAAGGIYRTYQDMLQNQQLYDYEDMILRAISALEANPDFKYTLAEQYQYIMLDEFQDTNPAQMRLVELLTDHPVLESRPNVMAVGDDDQAIYAFQGADHANMAHFTEVYKDVKVISLEDNYRSHTEILEVARSVAEQIEQRLHHNFPGVEKVLVASNKELPKPVSISCREFKSDAAENTWIAGEIKRLIDKENIPPSEIAVLAPKHKYLVALLPFLSVLNVPVNYEKRENILDAPLTRQLTQMSRLVLALKNNNDGLADELWAEVLSYDFWNLDVDKIWSMSWAARSQHKPWTSALLEDRSTADIAKFFLRLKDLVTITPLEQMLDALIGLPEASKNLKLPLVSPLFEYNFAVGTGREEPEAFVELISNLSTLRSSLREWGRSNEEPLNLESFVQFIEGHREAGLSILNKSPYHNGADSVNLLTAYGAKGREFRAVFIIACQDDVWGSTSRSLGNRLSLPANLKYIRYQGASEDERLRLLFVALTRAKTHLYLTSYAHTLAGKPTTRLKYLDITEHEDGLRSNVLPARFAAVTQDGSDSITAETARHYWTGRHTPPLPPKLSAILRSHLQRYQLSATHLNQFVDLERAGPEIFFLKSILGFPEAPTQTTIYGTAIHDTLKWMGGELSRGNELPKEKGVIEIFTRQLMRMHLPAEQFELLVDKGRASLHMWYAQNAKELKPVDKYEYDFKDEGVFAGKAHLTGKVDRLIIDEKAKSIVVLDYKTGQSYERWEPNVIKLHKFRQQLMIYKLLVEGSTRFKGYKVEKGIVEFVEPNENGKIVQLELRYEDKELDRLQRLIAKVWQCTMRLEFPDVSKYPSNITGIKAFEKDLLNE